MEKIFGENLFQREDLLPAFRALLVAEDKPFECVGETEECLAALALLARQPEWMQYPLMQELTQLIRTDSLNGTSIETLVEQAFTPQKNESIPPHFREELYACWKTA
jgi:hypothetical protein